MLAVPFKQARKHRRWCCLWRWMSCSDQNPNLRRKQTTSSWNRHRVRVWDLEAGDHLCRAPKGLLSNIMYILVLVSIQGWTDSICTGTSTTEMPDGVLIVFSQFRYYFGRHMNGVGSDSTPISATKQWEIAWHDLCSTLNSTNILESTLRARQIFADWWLCRGRLTKSRGGFQRDL